MPVQINEVIIRAIITDDDKKSKASPQQADKKMGGHEEINKIEILELINEVIKNKNER